MNHSFKNYKMNLRPKDYTAQENLIAQVLDELGLRYDQQYEAYPYTLDFYIPEVRMCIEADGVYGHYRKRDIKRDMELMKRSTVNHILHVEGTIYSEIKETIWEALNNLQ